MRHKADITLKDRNGGTLFHYASSSGNVLVMKLIFSFCVALEARDSENDTPLQWAAHKGHSKAVEFMVQNGANVNAKIGQSKIALHWAAEFGHVDCVLTLIRFGSNIDDKDEDENTPLLLATAANKEEVVKCLVSNHAKVNAQERNGRAALHVAIQKGYTSCIEALKSEKLNCDIVDNYGATPLHLAVAFSQIEAAAKLVNEMGADVNAVDNKGRTALQVSLLLNKTAIADIIQTACHAALKGTSDVKRGIDALFHPMLEDADEKKSEVTCQARKQSTASSLVVSSALGMCVVHRFFFKL